MESVIEAIKELNTVTIKRAGERGSVAFRTD